MARRRRARRKDMLDWWQGVLDETKDFVDDSIDRIRDDDDEDFEDLEDEVAELRKSVAELNTKLDRLLAGGGKEPDREIAIPPSTTEKATDKEETKR